VSFLDMVRWAAFITGVILLAGLLIEYRRDTKNKREALATLKAAGIPVVCVCGWRNETHEGPCTPYADEHEETIARFEGWFGKSEQPKAPACGVASSCNSCHDCPDLTLLAIEETKPAIDTTKDSKLYMRGFEDGKALMQARMQSDRDALKAHWEEYKGNG